MDASSVSLSSREQTRTDAGDLSANFLKQIVCEAGWEGERVRVRGAKTLDMKNAFEVGSHRRPRWARQLAGLVGLLLVSLVVWNAGGCLAARIATAKRSPRTRYWPTRVRAEVLNLIAIVNYVLTPEEDNGWPSLAMGDGQTTAPTVGGVLMISAPTAVGSEFNADSWNKTGGSRVR